MLDRDIQVFYNLGFAGDHRNQIVVQFIRIEIMQPYPADSVYAAKPCKQPGQLPPAIEVGTVAGQILGHQDKLFVSVLRQGFGLGDDVLHAAAAEAAADFGNDAVGTEIVAAFGNQKVCPGLSGADDPRRLADGGAVVPDDTGGLSTGYLFDNLGDAVITAHADNGVHLRKLILHLRLIELGQAAGNNKLFQPAGFLEARRFQNGVDCFLLRVLNESAGINDNDIRLGLIRNQGVSGLPDAEDHLFRGNLIFSTAQ